MTTVPSVLPAAPAFPRLSPGRWPDGAGSNLGKLPPRDRVFALEAAIQGLDNQLAIPELTSHYLAGGVYVRELKLPAGTVATGYIHRCDHVVILLGDVSVYDETGERRYTGINIFTSKAGIKRAAYAHEDSRFITAHRLNNPTETDITAIERELVTTTYQDFEEFMLNRQGLLP